MQVAIVYKWLPGCLYPLYLCDVFYAQNHFYHISQCLFRLIPFYLAIVAYHAYQPERYDGRSFYDLVSYKP